MLTTLGAGGTSSSSSSFDGGTSVTPYGVQRTWHAGVTCSIGVVTVTVAHGSGAVATSCVARFVSGAAVPPGTGPPHAGTASVNTLSSAVAATLVATSPETVRQRHGHRADGDGAEGSSAHDSATLPG